MNACGSIAVSAVLVVLGWMPEGLAADRQHHAAMMAGSPIEAGQGAFAAMAEAVALLEADPATDWSKVGISTLREHLVDMSTLILEAVSDEKPLANGLSMTVTGTDRLRDAIQRMVPAHAVELDKMPGWSASAEVLPGGARLTVTAMEPAIQAKIRGLGFFGLMATGSHHQAHHLAIAKGELVHQHH